MQVLVMGGSGLIGKAFAREMVSGGHHVVVLTRRPGQAVLPDGVEMCAWDGRSTAGWLEQVESADVLVNLSGENIGGGLWTAERKHRIADSREQAGRLMSEAVQKARKRPALLMQASAIGHYGNVPTGQVTETTAPGTDFMARVTVQWEASTRVVEDLGLRRVIIRSGLVLHPSEGILPRFLLPVRLFAGGPMGSGKQGISWIHIRDQVRAMRFLIENPSSHGAYNLSGPAPVSNAEFGKALARVVRRPYWIPAPAFALRLLLGEMSTLLLEGQFVLPQRLTAEGFQFLFPQLDSALQDLLG